jgi:hypothetical protein
MSLECQPVQFKHRSLIALRRFNSLTIVPLDVRILTLMMRCLWRFPAPQSVFNTLTLSEPFSKPVAIKSHGAFPNAGERDLAACHEAIQATKRQF